MLELAESRVLQWSCEFMDMQRADVGLGCGPLSAVTCRVQRGTVFTPSQVHAEIRGEEVACEFRCMLRREEGCGLKSAGT